MRSADLARAGWRKSSRSAPNGACVEVARVEMRDAGWRKSSRSSPNGDCVEAAAARSAVAVRDSKDPDGPVLAVGPRAWEALTGRIKRGGLSTSPRTDCSLIGTIATPSRVSVRS